MMIPFTRDPFAFNAYFILILGMRALIIDDEAAVRATTFTLVNIYAPDIEIIGQAGSVQQAFDLINATSPDLVFLDVEMKDGTGFDLLNKFDHLTFKVIFITGHNEYAVRAFKFSAIDYLLKPLDPDDLNNAIAKVRKSVGSDYYALQLKAFQINTQTQNDLPAKIILKDAESIHLIEVVDIIRCQSEDNYTRFYIKDQNEILVSKTLKEYDKLFRSNTFFRAHQSHLINLNHFARYDKKEGGIVVMKDGSTLPVAVRKKDALFTALDKLT